jgi:PKD repeat protein
VRAAELDDITLYPGELHLFNGIYSTAYKCNIIDYSWDFGDGTTSNDIASDHSFSGNGTYEVQLTVTSDGGHSDSSTMTVTVTGGGGSTTTTTSGSSTTTTSGGSTTTTTNGGSTTTTTSGGSTTTTSGGSTTTTAATTTSGKNNEESLKDAHNFPNPFNPEITSTNIRYSIAEETNITIKIFDTGNNLVKTLLEDEAQEVPTGDYYNIEWDGKNGRGETVANGLYFFMIETSEGYRKIGKIAVIR